MKQPDLFGWLASAVFEAVVADESFAHAAALGTMRSAMRIGIGALPPLILPLIVVGMLFSGCKGGGSSFGAVCGEPHLKANPVRSRSVSKSARCLGTAGLEDTPAERSPGTERSLLGSTMRGVATIPSYSTTDIRSFFDQCASTGSPEQHGHAQRLLEYRLALVRSLARPHHTDVVLDLGCGNGHHLLALGPEIARGIGIDISPGMIELACARLRTPPWRTNLAFEVGDAEELKGIADESIDLAICIGAFEHLLDKRAALTSIYRVLKFGGRFVCLTLHANYVWYRTLAPLLGFATKHLSSDRILTRGEFVLLLGQAGFRGTRFAPWTFIPKGDVPAAVALLLTLLDAIGRHARLDSFRGGLSLCAWKQAEST